MSRLPGYRGNANLKNANTRLEFTPEQIQEWMKCMEDPIYFIETYMMIISLGKLSHFKLYDWQKDVIKSYQHNTRTILATCRQGGKSTTTVGFILWLLLFHSYKTVAILANKGDVAQEMVQRIQFGYEHLPLWLQQGIIAGGWNKTSITLENNSRVFSAATSKDSISGFTVDFLMVDEVAKIENWDDFWTASSQTLSSNPNAKIAMISTPLGLNHFWEFWSNAIKGKNDFKPFKVTWNMIPGRDEFWKQKTLADLNFDTEKFAQEQEVEFLGSSGTLISGWKLKQLVEQGPAIPLIDKAGVKQYKPALFGHQYMCIADVSEGKGLDYSAFQVIDISKLPYEQVCTFDDNITPPHEYAEILFKIGKLFNNCPILVENNNIGTSVVEALYEDFEYENLIYTQSNGRQGKGISNSMTRGTEMGIKTTKTVKSVGCSIIKLLIEQDKLLLCDAQTIYELSTFSRKKKSFEAEPGKFDDLVMCLVLFAWLTEQPYFKELSNIYTLANLREKNKEQFENEMAPFFLIEDGQPEEEGRLEVTNWPYMPFPQWP